MRFLLFTTTDLSADRGADLVRLVESIRLAAPNTEIKMFVLLQRADEADRQRYGRWLPPGSVIVTESGRMPLSAARNRLLEHAKADNAITDNSIIGFPDDDCWYPPGFADRLVQWFCDDARLDMLACRVSLNPVAPGRVGPMLAPARAFQIVRGSSSNSMFFRGGLVMTLGAFDLSLGLGTANGGGEDTDYALRGFLRAGRAVFVDAPLVGHRQSDLVSVARYFRGSAIALGRYAARSPALFLEFTRKLAVGAYLALRCRLSVAEYLASIASGVGEVQRSLTTRASLGSR